MGDRFDWRWWLRRECRAIAAVDQLPPDEWHSGGVAVHLCHRRRFHLGPCRADR